MFHFGPLFLQMSSSCDSILDHIAGYLKFISKAQSLWFMLIRAMTMAATLPVDSVWSRTTTRCSSPLPALHRIHNWALQSSPWPGESSLAGIDLQLTIALLSSNKRRLTSMHTSLEHGRLAVIEGGSTSCKLAIKMSNRQTELRTRGVLMGN